MKSPQGWIEPGQHLSLMSSQLFCGAWFKSIKIRNDWCSRRWSCHFHIKGNGFQYSTPESMELNTLRFVFQRFQWKLSIETNDKDWTANKLPIRSYYFFNFQDWAWNRWNSFCILFPPAQAIFKIRDLQYHTRQPLPLEMWARWDSEWYLLIADHGYASYEYFKDAGGGKYLQQDSSKFFPAYPIAIRTLTVITGNSVLSGFLIPILVHCSSCISFFVLLQNSWALKILSMLRSCILSFPTSLFLSAIYAESMFLAAIVAAFLFIEERKLLPALIACAIAVLTRPQGALATPALAWVACKDSIGGGFLQQQGLLLLFVFHSPAIDVYR